MTDFIQNMRSILNDDWKVIKETILEGYPSVKKIIEEDPTSITFYNNTYASDVVFRRLLEKRARIRATYTFFENIWYKFCREKPILDDLRDKIYDFDDLKIRIEELLETKYPNMKIGLMFHQKSTGSYVIFTNNSNPHISIQHPAYLESHRQIIHEVPLDRNRNRIQMFVP